MVSNSFLLNSVERFALLKNCITLVLSSWMLNNCIIVRLWLLLLNHSYTHLLFCDKILQLLLHEIDKEFVFHFILVNAHILRFFWKFLAQKWLTRAFWWKHVFLSSCRAVLFLLLDCDWFLSDWLTCKSLFLIAKTICNTLIIKIPWNISLRIQRLK